jgi:hypothetical protein
MSGLFYILMIFFGSIFGAGLGYFANFVRGDMGGPEQLLEGGMITNIVNDMMNRHDLMFEEHVVGAKWDKDGYWDSSNNRNLMYYMVSGFMLPIIFGAIFWPFHVQVVEATCHGLQNMGFHPPLC